MLLFLVGQIRVRVFDVRMYWRSCVNATYPAAPQLVTIFGGLTKTVDLRLNLVH